MKLASLLAWCRVFFGMAPGGSGVEAPAIEETVACHLHQFFGMLSVELSRHAGEVAGGGGGAGRAAVSWCVSSVVTSLCSCSDEFPQFFFFD